jgi:predicted metal-dependent enzyme (double-stranded beta helix superfamily)
MATQSPRTQTGLDEFYVDTPVVRALIDEVRVAMADHPDDAAAGLESLRLTFARLLIDQHWLPEPFADVCATSAMGGGIGQWLLFRSGDRSLSLFSLVIPAGSETPVHDHLAWGLVGLYRGEQEETVYRRIDDGQVNDHATLEVVEVRPLHVGDFYVLLPPDGDIHAVRTTSPGASVSIHLLGNDAGCVWRHAFAPTEKRVRSFRSGYSNVACVETSPGA